MVLHTLGKRGPLGIQVRFLVGACLCFRTRTFYNQEEYAIFMGFEKNDKKGKSWYRQWGVIIISIVVSLVIIMVLSYDALDYSTPKESSLISGNNYSTSYPSIFKEPTSFIGYTYCSFVFYNESYFNKSRFLFKSLCNISQYPIIKDFLYDYYSINLIEFDNFTFISAQYVGNGNIEINNHFRHAKNLDLYLAHEVAHSATETLNLPIWLDEGIAQYSSYRYFGTHFKLDNVLIYEDILHWDPSYSISEYGDDNRAYAYASYVVKKFVDKYGDTKLRELIIALDGKINFEDSIDVKNQKILEVIQKVTNNPALTIEEIIYPKD